MIQRGEWGMGNFSNTGLLAVIPAYNEEISIGSVVLKAKNYVDSIIVIDDGSDDLTSEIARLAGATVIKHEKNGGYGAAIKSCFKYAKESDANILVIFDSDGQHDPSEIPHLVKKINEEDVDIVIGSRLLNGNDGIPTYRKFGMKVLNTVTNAASGLNISDTQSGYRAYSRDAIDKLVINGSGMSAASEILIQARKNNLKTEEVPIICKYDVDNPSTHNPVSHGIDVLVGIARVVGINRPLSYLGLSGFLMLSSGFVLVGRLIQSYNTGGNLPFGPSILMMILIIVGSLTTFTGLMLHVMIRLIKESDTSFS